MQLKTIPSVGLRPHIVVLDPSTRVSDCTKNKYIYIAIKLCTIKSEYINLEIYI